MARWYDYRFKGIDNGVESEPPVKLFIMGENRWRFEHEWPLARTQYTEFFLHSDGSANTVRGDGMLSVSEPGDEPPDVYDYDPKDPVMSLMGIDAQAAPRDQSPLNGREDILVYQTPPLQEDIEVTGPVTLKLWGASSAPDTDFTAKLIDVHPNGLAVNLTYGIMRARYRNGYENPSLIEPGQPYEYHHPTSNPTGILFRRGHRIRLDVVKLRFPQLCIATTTPAQISGRIRSFESRIRLSFKCGLSVSAYPADHTPMKYSHNLIEARCEKWQFGKFCYLGIPNFLRGVSLCKRRS